MREKWSKSSPSQEYTAELCRPGLSVQQEAGLAVGPVVRGGAEERLDPLLLEEVLEVLALGEHIAMVRDDAPRLELKGASGTSEELGIDGAQRAGMTARMPEGQTVGSGWNQRDRPRRQRVDIRVLGEKGGVGGRQAVAVTQRGF